MVRVKSVRRLLANELPALSLIAYPLAAFILGNLLFDRIGAPFSFHVLQAASSVKAGSNPNEAIADGHAWAAMAHLYLFVQFFGLATLLRWLWASAKGCLAFGYLSIACLLIVLGISDLVNVRNYSRPLYAIFLFTFRSLQVDRQLHTAPIIAFVNDTLTSINLLSIILPAVLCAITPPASA